MSIIDVIMGIVLIACAISFIKEYGWVDGGKKLVIIFILLLLVTALPHYFGETGKYVLLVLLGAILLFIFIKIGRKNKTEDETEL